MPEVDFADGFDVSEPLLWGLTPAQLGSIAAGVVVAYLAVRSPLPAAAGLAVAVFATGCGAALALIRYEARTLVDWLGDAARFRARPRRGLLTVVDGSEPRAATGVALAMRASEAPRRARVVLLPEPAPEMPERTEVAEPAPPPANREPEARVAQARFEVLSPGHDPWDLFNATPEPRPGSRRITFFSLSGGSGRTTLAVEMAGLLACRSAAPWPAPGVALVDLDLLSPRASLRLGVPLAADWADLLAALPAPGIFDELMRVHRCGLRLVPGPARVPLQDGGPSLLSRLGGLVAAVEAAGCRTVILDVPCGLSPVTRWALEAAHDIFVVLTPTAGGIQDAYRSTEALRRLGLGRKLRHVVNRGPGAALFSETMQDLGSAVSAEIPSDPELARAEAQHRLVAVEGTGPTATALRTLAASVDARLTTTRHGGRGTHRPLRRRAS